MLPPPGPNDFSQNTAVENCPDIVTEEIGGPSGPPETHWRFPLVNREKVVGALTKFVAKLGPSACRRI